MFILGSLESAPDFLSVLNDFFAIGVTTKAMREKIVRKSAIAQRGQFDLKFQVEGIVDPNNHYRTDS